MKQIEVLMSTTKIKDKQEFIEKINSANVTTNIIIVNQISRGKPEKVLKMNEKQEIYNIKETGASKSRNKLLKLATKDICIFADDDIKYVEKYDELILNEYKKHPKADGIVFYVDNINSNREKNKKLNRGKFRFFDVMKARIYELSLTKNAIEKIKINNVKFNCDFGPGGIFFKGEDTIFLAELLKLNLKVYCSDKKIGTVGDDNSSWFKGVNCKYLYDQGAIFYKIAPKLYNFLIFQYVIRKYELYSKNMKMREAYIEMKKGAQFAKKLSEGNIDFDGQI